MSSSNGTHSPAERFFTRFAGLERAHGSYRPDGTERADGKNEGHAETIKAPPT
jgi:hypothetical protein